MWNRLHEEFKKDPKVLADLIGNFVGKGDLFKFIKYTDITSDIAKLDKVNDAYKVSNKTKDILPREMGKARVFTSKDPLVGDLANSIEAEMPGKIVDINKEVYRPDGTILTDFDIELDNVVIQVKSGGGKGLTTQLQNTATGTDKIVVGYVPGIKPSVLKGANNAGFDVFRTLEELLEFLK